MRQCDNGVVIYGLFIVVPVCFVAICCVLCCSVSFYPLSPKGGLILMACLIQSKVLCQFVLFCVVLGVLYHSFCLNCCVLLQICLNMRAVDETARGCFEGDACSFGINGLICPVPVPGKEVVLDEKYVFCFHVL